MEGNIKDLIIIGCGGFGREVASLVRRINEKRVEWNLLGFLDDNPPNSKVANLNVLGKVTDANKFLNCYFVISLGNPQIKKDVLKNLPSNSRFATLIHPHVEIGDRSRIGFGSIICAGTIITVDTTIGNHVILNLGCTVGHDAFIGDYVSIMPSTNISGEVEIEECVYIGTGTKIINQVKIGRNAILGAGSVVSKSIPDNCTAVGVPAKPIKFHNA